ncbi:putative sigma54 specific transcriptional regulator [Solidesulfovibrio carbinoliphilus subsp. oakridgensis]|uniref:Sigma54 specific transcriptional regulator n=1 Tax=Solidesulfovibrio carbinoliphilus subsp. oakridgensis TaxID=694327 RepID=G7Q8Y4_9BACT|nr:sigma 54-interacting transcriptional regulator [Solidesulfovibrio carbinoliphilus]EHJ47470.1 putative sigma54 specific transcriptional regulator [Solidesulfovibrio carbinoliphilus subsp. oakridgensis]
MAAPFTDADILRSLSGPLVAVDADGRVATSNPAALALFGPEAAGPGAALPLARPDLWQPVARCLAEAAPAGARIETAAGPLGLCVLPIVRDGRTVGATLVADAPVPGQTPALDSRLRSILDSVSDGIWICDGDGTILEINAASQRLNSIRAADYVGKNVQCIVAERMVDRSATLDVIATGRQASMIQHITRTGKQLLVTGTPVLDAAGAVALVVVNERDVTELLNLRQSLQNARTVEERYKSELAELSLFELSQKDIVAQSPQMQRTLRTLLKLAQMDATRILLLGESGTGKGLLAKFLHQVSPRAEKPFIQINCPAVPENLFEAELFGYERGAFTGAREGGKAGLIELAKGGTLFLDEVGDIPLSAQAKLLKYLDDHELRRLGGGESRIVECRVVAATNCDMEGLVERRQFRKDLYYRLNTFIVRIAPLRERRDDIFGLAEFYLSQQNARHGKAKRLSPRAMRLLEAYDFPGNVRELVNLIQKAFVMSDDDDLTEALDEALSGDGGPDTARPGPRRLVESTDQASLRRLREAMAACRTTRQMAAYLGISQATVVRKLKRYALHRD